MRAVRMNEMTLTVTGCRNRRARSEPRARDHVPHTILCDLT
jgi:hypothetical protein